MNIANVWNEKVWGITKPIFYNPMSEIHHLKIKAGGYSSIHKHEHKWNRFYILSGKLNIIIFEPISEDIEGFSIPIIHTIKEEEYLDVPPRVYHKFIAHENCCCIETYWLNHIDINDIIRSTVGGML